MEHNFPVALFGAVVSSTFGCLLSRLYFCAKYNIISVIWLMSFSSSFVIFFLIVGNAAQWLVSLIGCSFFPVVGSRYYGAGEDCEEDLDYFWGMGCGVFLLTVSVLMVFSSKWFLGGFNYIFRGDGYIIYTLGLFVVGGVGICAVLQNKNS